jgi:hypothetical protein
MIQKATIPILLLGLMLLSAGCAARGTQTPAEEPTQPPEPSPLSPPLHGESTNRAQDAAQRARDALARRLDVDSEQVSIVSVEAVDWPDASLGCPEPGKLYAQVITPGYRIVLETGGERHEYHSDSEAKQVIRCQDDQERLQSMRQKSSPEQAVITAQQDLASRLGIAIDDVAITRVTEEMFPAGDLGCPCPGCPESPMTGLVSGQRIILHARGSEYEYRARGMAVLFCGER